MPRIAPITKVQNCKDLNATVVIQGAHISGACDLGLRSLFDYTPSFFCCSQNRAKLLSKSGFGKVSRTSMGSMTRMVR
jgi:threonine dehydratase